MSTTMDSVRAEITYRQQQVRRSARRTIRKRTEDSRSQGRTDRPRKS